MKKALIPLLALFLLSCEEGTLPDPSPGNPDALNLSLDLDQSEYSKLRTIGQSHLLVKEKIIVARIEGNNFKAVSGYCPSDGITHITYNSSNKTFSCSKDNITYDLDGKAKSGGNHLTAYKAWFVVNNSNGIVRIAEN